MEELIEKLENACWAFYHIHKGTAEHLNSQNRIYAIADLLKEKYGITDDELEKICEKQM